MKLVMATTSIGRVTGLELDRGGDPVETGHDEVHHDHVGEQRRRCLERRDAVGGLADDLEVVVQVEEVAHAAADHGVVVDDQDTDPAAHALAAAAGTGGPGAALAGLAPVVIGDAPDGRRDRPPRSRVR